MRTYVDAVPVPACRTRPQAKAFVMLRGQHHVLCSGVSKQLRPLVGIKEPGFQPTGKILVMEVRAAIAHVEKQRKVLRLEHVVPEPLGISVATVGVRVREDRDSINSPVDEDAE